LQGFITSLIIDGIEARLTYFIEKPIGKTAHKIYVSTLYYVNNFE